MTKTSKTYVGETIETVLESFAREKNALPSIETKSFIVKIYERGKSPILGTGEDRLSHIAYEKARRAAEIESFDPEIYQLEVNLAITYEKPSKRRRKTAPRRAAGCEAKHPSPLDLTDKLF